MAPQALTEYERRRLENIKRNDEMMAALKLRSRAEELSSSTKRNRIENKAYKISPEKKPKTETPIVIRRSLRARRIPADSLSEKDLEDDHVSSPKKIPESSTRSKTSRRTLGSISMQDAYSGIASDRNLIDTIISMSKNIQLDFSIKNESCPSKMESSGDKSAQEAALGSSKNVHSSCVVKRELDMNGSSRDSIMNMSENAPSSNLVKMESSGDKSAQEATLGSSKNGHLSCVVKKEVDMNGASHDSIMNMSENAPSSHLVKKESGENIGSGYMNSGMPGSVPFNCQIKKERDRVVSSFNVRSLRLRPENIAQLMPGKILDVRFFPSTHRTLIVAGNKFGNVGFWDVDNKEDEGDGIYLYQPHSGPISAILIRPYSVSKVFSSCYDGFIRLMDVEKENFNLIYSGEDAIFSLSQHPQDAQSLYFSEGRGKLHVWDERAGKLSSSWMLHEQRINSIDFNVENTNLMATSSTDGKTCIWDLRSIGSADGPKSFKTFDHKRTVHSAYFSPSGSHLATTRWHSWH
ncbi:PREDICTED: WD repeat-containing protein 76-like isoform X2 [Nelumbo nucifera]|uniref:WD repeat-containing protein 76-like isoform X2 n=1 Tax=Nelumbo nucifera TaxID=4432 RepID=A0A1U7ZDS1_NELNU|nr:PREDICTED: WD repeat-containing protein 76-like isoform X2 [Nelumbo nucifera]